MRNLIREGVCICLVTVQQTHYTARHVAWLVLMSYHGQLTLLEGDQAMHRQIHEVSLFMVLIGNKKKNGQNVDDSTSL